MLPGGQQHAGPRSVRVVDVAFRDDGACSYLSNKLADSGLAAHSHDTVPCSPARLCPPRLCPARLCPARLCPARLCPARLCLSPPPRLPASPPLPCPPPRLLASQS